MLEYYRLNQLILPFMILMLVVSGIIGYITVTRAEKKERVRSYHKTLLYEVLTSCTVPAILIIFVFPLLKVYSWHLVPVLIALVMGMIIYITGVILEAKYFIWSSIVWWIGSVALVFVSGITPRVIFMAAMMFFGWILPGYILNKKYKKRGMENES